MLTLTPAGTSGPVARCTACAPPKAQIEGVEAVNNACDDDLPSQGLMLSGKCLDWELEGLDACH
eukprot:scaffold126411_cov20-Tisochrysis_lutea.AAC.1